MSIQERQEEVIEEFSMFDDWMDKYEYLISLGKELPLIAEDKKEEFFNYFWRCFGIIRGSTDPLPG